MSDMGDGDLYDPDDLSDAELTGTVSRSASESAAAADAAAASTTDGDDTPERQSEFDDIDTLSALDFDTPDASGAEADIDWSEVDVPALLAERDEFKSIAQRVQAEFENFRKQANIRAQADADRATGRLAEAFLPVLDAAEAAFLRHPDEVGPLLNQMLTELKKQGLESLDLDGQLFDPEVAEAVAHEPVDGGEPLVAEVLRSGYQWKGKTLRAAMVKTKD
ncbi:MAG: nucleotide exchange factor GrpE [Ilumatobacter sp.]|jgi:molecular chaperone GrpE|uniref:nucleotide exchange factor GrpE n=1 Tax=Ilumatobacter sp. TaxID=1967498 RepID=UPI001D7AA1F1|nr:nucleotide exchange factor GrpE [Ilumatobacter sp.]MBT5276924.1 nucleotide exchange factor GrpE [Ilumatobacter sp.]MBT5554185.1 nucleotide exchange factor GrpE [Ilumatobacter sp.]MBT5866229.1 nucleotide exchange factor GrpE [Ilumatobacter sp.]MDG0976788.1 nucleotide exchange factor GrpE [Ilumatobacter sp.]